MAILPSFYNQVDQDIYEGGEHFIPRQDYRLNYTPSTSLASTVGNTGITNTQSARSYYPQGGGGGGTGGNVFGYGTPIDPVSYGAWGEPGYIGGLPGDVTQKGLGRNMMGDIDPNYDPDDPDSQWMSSQEYLTGKRKQLPGFASMAMSFIPGGNWLRGKIENRMNDPRGGGGYGIAGLSDAQKGAYNQLAAQGMLFEGPSGLKTLTGKNFNAHNYISNQLEIAKGFGFDTMSDEEIDAAIAAEAKRHGGLHKGNKGFMWKKMKEAKTIYQQNKSGVGGDGTTGDGTTGDGKITTGGNYGAAAGTTGSWTPGGTYTAPTTNTGYQQQEGSHHPDSEPKSDTSSANNVPPSMRAQGGRIVYFDGGIARLL